MSESLNDLLPLSPDHNAERLAALKQLFPDLFSNDGRLNVDELKKVVDPALVSETERYDFRWYGKTKSKREAFTPSRAALVNDAARSVNPEKAGGNLIIEGENLEVLKLLTSAYRQQVKCIYIDPPYNTGKDFVYSDNFAEGQKPYWEQTGVTEGGVKVDTNTDSDGRFHSNWLSMIHSRLLVARYLLKPEGVIFVSIDDGEVFNLRRVMDEVFGEENFVGILIWKGATDNNPTRVATEHEYIICYSRDKEHVAPVWKNETDEAKAVLLAEYRRIATNKLFTAEDIQRELRAFIRQNKEALNGISHYDRVDDRGVFTGSRKVHNPKPGGYKYDVYFKDTKKVCAPPVNGYRFPPATMNQLLADERILFGDDETQIIQIKEYLEDYVGKLSSVIALDSRTGSNEVTDIFGEQKIFTNPKPSVLLREFFRFVLSKDDIILDFFGGSGTTAQAVTELNKADGGNRKFILVQLPELTDASSPAHKAGFKKISDITIERAKRVVQKLKTEAEGLLPNDPQRQFADALGFKVFTLAKSAFPRVEFAPDPAKTEAENIELLKQYIRDKEATFDLTFDKDKVLDEVLLKNGFMLDYTLTRQPGFKKNEVLLAKDAHKESLVCLDAKLEPETVDHFKTNKDKFFICLELALDTTKKWNLKHNLGEKLKAI
jgi:adenine-specific DNA-methyltransferase